jgi:hypothetical protein
VTVDLQQHGGGRYRFGPELSRVLTYLSGQVVEMLAQIEKNKSLEKSREYLARGFVTPVRNFARQS